LVSENRIQGAGLQKDRDRGNTGPKEGLGPIGRFGFKGTTKSEKHLMYIVMIFTYAFEGFLNLPLIS
jgi:hypothetical protein